MNLNELRTFLEVIETGSLVAASQRLNVTQSTVTARIASLEDELGQKLIHRYKSGAELTSAGFKFRRYAEVMVQLWRQARYEVSLPKGFRGVCNVGLEFDLWQGIGERFLDHLRRDVPGVVIALWPGEQRQIDRWLSIGLVDIAFCYVPQAGEDFNSRVLFDDELVMVSTMDDAAAQLGSRYVFVDHGDEFRRRHAEALQQARIKLQDAFQARGQRPFRMQQFRSLDRDPRQLTDCRRKSNSSGVTGTRFSELTESTISLPCASLHPRGNTTAV